VRAAVLALALATACSSTVRYRSSMWRGDECARGCRRRHSGGDQAACLESCPGVEKERGSCSERPASRPGEVCAEFKESAGKAPVITAVAVGVAVIVVVVLLAMQPPDFHR
jgi:hypothetical protein